MSDIPQEIKLTYFIALGMVIVLIGFIVLFVFTYRRKQQVLMQQKELNKIRHQKVLLEKETEKRNLLEKERERISCDMHDDLGATISAIKLQAEFIKEQLKNTSISAEVDSLINISEEMNCSMREMLWSMRSDYDNLGEFLKYTTKYGNGFFRNAKILFNVIQNVEDSKVELTTEKRRNLFLCIKEGMNNALKHSKATEVTLLVEQKNNKISVSLSDNGVGINEVKKDGYGMQTMRKRMEAVKGEFNILPQNKGAKLNFVLFT